MKKRTKIIILIFLIIFIFVYVKLGTFIDDKWRSFWYKSSIEEFTYQDKEGTQHFPKEIPKSARKIEYIKLYGRRSMCFYLKMKMDKDWILRQINSYSYSEVESPDNYGDFFHRTVSDYVKQPGFTYYVIYTDKESYCPFYYGLATNKNFDEIYYYYSVRH